MQAVGRLVCGGAYALSNVRFGSKADIDERPILRNLFITSLWFVANQATPSADPNNQEAVGKGTADAASRSTSADPNWSSYPPYTKGWKQVSINKLICCFKKELPKNCQELNCCRFFYRKISSNYLIIGGEGGIRTPGRDQPTTVFKTAALNHSATSPYLYISMRYSTY